MKDLRTFMTAFVNQLLKESRPTAITPNRYVYHTSNPMFRDAIAKNGLIAKGRSESWLTTTAIEGKVVFAVNSDDPKDWWDSTYDDDVYRIDTSALDNQWYQDPNFQADTNRIYTHENIPAAAIKLIRLGTGQSTQ